MTRLAGCCDMTSQMMSEGGGQWEVGDSCDVIQEHVQKTLDEDRMFQNEMSEGEKKLP